VRSFRAWPRTAEPTDLKEVFAVDHDGVRLAAYDFTSQGPVRLRLYVAQRTGLAQPELNVLSVCDDNAWQEFLATFRPAFETELKDEPLPEAKSTEWQSTKKTLASFPWIMSYVAPRGVGPTAFDQTDRKQVQHRRRFYLLGQTLDSQQLLDVRRSIQATREVSGLSAVPLWLQAQNNMAGVTLYASLFEPDIKRIDLYDLPKSHRSGPTFLNVERFLDLPEALAMAAERSKIVLYQDDDTGWEYPQAVAKSLNWPDKQVQIRRKPSKE